MYSSLSREKTKKIKSKTLLFKNRRQGTKNASDLQKTQKLLLVSHFISYISKIEEYTNIRRIISTYNKAEKIGLRIFNRNIEELISLIKNRVDVVFLKNKYYVRGSKYFIWVDHV